jgi:hypothetical protein
MNAFPITCNYKSLILLLSEYRTLGRVGRIGRIDWEPKFKDPNLEDTLE